MIGIPDVFYGIARDKSLFCFFYDIDPIFESLDSINRFARLIEYYGLDDYICENWINKDSQWKL